VAQSFNQNSPTKIPFLNQRGQGLIEYLIIVALMGVATIGIIRVMSQAVAARFVSVTYALRGESHKAENAPVEKSLYKKKDLGDFFNGAGKGSAKSEGSSGDSESGSETGAE
jgi:pilus assembly protein Flp/PilA